MGIQEVFQAVKEGNLSQVRKIREQDLPELPYETLVIQDAKSLNGNKPIYDVLLGYYQACDADCRAKMVVQLNLLVRRSLREAYPYFGNEIEGIYVGMLVPYGRIDLVDHTAFLETWNNFVGNSLPV